MKCYVKLFFGLGNDEIHEPANNGTESEHDEQDRHIRIKEQRNETDSSARQRAVPCDARPLRLMGNDEYCRKAYDDRDRAEPPRIDPFHSVYYYATI